MLYKAGVINFPYIVKVNPLYSFVTVSPLVYKTSTAYRRVRLASTPSKYFSIKLKTLQMLQHALGDTLIILETSHGFMTNQEALKLKLGGKILLIID